MSADRHLGAVAKCAKHSGDEVNRHRAGKIEAGGKDYWGPGFLRGIDDRTSVLPSEDIEGGDAVTVGDRRSKNGRQIDQHGALSLELGDHVLDAGYRFDLIRVGRMEKLHKRPLAL